MTAPDASTPADTDSAGRESAPALSRLRVRGHLPAVPAPARKRGAARYRPRVGDPALLLHVLTDAQDRVRLVIVFEVELTAGGAVTIAERWFAPAAQS